MKVELKIGDLVEILSDNSGPKTGRIINIIYNPEAPELSKCIVERKVSFVHTKIKNLKKLEEVR